MTDNDQPHAARPASSAALTDAWERDRLAVARKTHTTWRQDNLARGVPDHPYDDHLECCAHKEDSHEYDMVAFDDLRPESQAQYASFEAYRIGYEAGAADLAATREALAAMTAENPDCLGHVPVGWDEHTSGICDRCQQPFPCEVRRMWILNAQATERRAAAEAQVATLREELESVGRHANRITRAMRPILVYFAEVIRMEDDSGSPQLGDKLLGVNDVMLRRSDIRAVLAVFPEPSSAATAPQADPATCPCIRWAWTPDMEPWFETKLLHHPRCQVTHVTTGTTTVTATVHVSPDAAPETLSALGEMVTLAAQALEDGTLPPPQAAAGGESDSTWWALRFGNHLRGCDECERTKGVPACSVGKRIQDKIVDGSPRIDDWEAAVADPPATPSEGDA